MELGAFGMHRSFLGKTESQVELCPRNEVFICGPNRLPSSLPHCYVAEPVQSNGIDLKRIMTLTGLQAKLFDRVSAAIA